MDKYTTPNGQEIEESILRDKYGDRFDALVSEGVLKKKEDTESVLEAGSLEQQEKPELTPYLELNVFGKPTVKLIETDEEPTLIERAVGKNTLTDFFGDLYRSGVKGVAQGATLDEAYAVFSSGKDVSKEDLDDYIAVVQKMESYAPSDEMKDYENTFEESGGGVLGFVKGVAKNPTVVPELFVSSLVASINPTVAASAGTAALTGAGIGGAVAGPVGAGAGAIYGTIAGMSGALEVGLSFTEFLQEEIKNKNLEFDNEGIMEVLEDPDAMTRIRNKSIARGATIAAVDAFSGGLASKLTTKIATKAASKLAGTTTGIGVEAAGGSAGEALARTVTGQEMDISEILFEGVAGTTTAPFTVGQGLLKTPVYKINDGPTTRREFQGFLETSTPEQIAAAKISVKNDKELYNQALSKQSDAILLNDIKTANPGITEADSVDLLALEKRRKTLEGSSLKSAKNNLTLIDEKIDAISKKYSATEAEIITTEEEVRTSLENKGITDPTPQQLVEESDLLTQKKIKDAVQEPSAKTPPVSDQSRVGKEVGERDTAGEITGEVAPQEETISSTKPEVKKEVVQQVETSKEEKPTGFVTKPSIKEPFIVPTKRKTPSNTQINFTEDGKIESVVNKKTGEPVSAGTRKAAEKIYLESIVDVDEGKKFDFEEGMRPDEINSIIAEESDNVREIAEAIENEKEVLIKKKREGVVLFDNDDDISNVAGTKFTSESWEEYTGLPPKDDKISRFWIDDVNGVSIKDGWISSLIRQDELPVDVTDRISTQDVVDFIKQYNTQDKVLKLKGQKGSKTKALIDLENKFEKLTGLKATPTNVKTVVSLEQGRAPIEVLKAQEKEQLTREATEPGVFGKKRAPSAEKITAAPKKELTVDEAKALSDQIKLEVKAAREAKGDQTKRRAALSEAIKSIESIGKVAAKKVKAIVNKVSTVNLNNPLSVQKALSYVNNVLTKADYDEKLNQAKELRKKIKKLSKNKSLEDNTVVSAKRFTDIEPALLEDIESYIDEATQVKDGLTPSKATKIMPALNIDRVNKYSDTQLGNQSKIKIEAEKETFQDLTGLSPDEFSLQEMREIVHGVDQDQTNEARENELKSKAKAKAVEIKKGLNKAFKTFSTIANQLIEDSVDPFTGDKVDIKKSTKELIKEFINIDIDRLSDTDALIALDSLINFATNLNTGGMGAIVERNKGKLNAKTFLDLGVIAKPLFAITDKMKLSGITARGWGEYISALPLLIQTMFKGQSRALKFEKLSGFSDLMRGVSNARKYANEIAAKYSKKFMNLKANGESFNTAFNDTERGMFAFVRRSIPGEEQVEFDRRKSLIEQSIAELNESDPEKAKIYDEVYNKILKDANNVLDVESNVDKVNIEAVEWMTNVWAENYEALSDVNLDIYNKILGKDVNYTHDSYSLLTGKSKDIAQIGEPLFDFALKKISDKKTGVLMDVKKPNNLPKDRFVNLGFDSQNISSLERAVTDVNTARAIQQLKGFFESENFKKIVPSNDDRKILTDRVIEYVEAKRGRDYISNDAKEILSAVNTYSAYAVGRTLGGLFQPIKQTVPVYVNTMLNAGPVALAKATNLMATNPEANKFVKNSGYSIATRGLESVSTLDNLNNKLKNAASGTKEVVVESVNKLQRFWLQNFLVKPDAYIARLSWLTYYIKSLENQGVDVSNIDWSTHEVNSKAGDYAQQQVDRQQNVSDSDLQGKIFTSKKPWIQFARKVLLPFSNFLLNQKTRMYSDSTVIASKTATREDKVAAMRSLSGLVAETVSFHLIGLGLTQLLAGMSAESKEEKEERDKKFNNRIKGRAGQALLDIVSPIPLKVVGDPVIEATNAILRIIDSSEDPYQFFEQQKLESWENLGLFSIPLSRSSEWLEMTNMAFFGEFEVDKPFGGTSTKKITGKGRDEMLTNWLMYSLYLYPGLLPSEAGSVARYNTNYVKKNMLD